MNIDTIAISSIKEAKKHTDKKRFKDYKFDLSEFDFEELKGLYNTRLGDHPKNDRQQNYVDLKNMLIEELASPITDKLNNDSYNSLREFTAELDDASNKLMYRMLSVLDKTQFELSKDWLSAKITESDITNCVRDKIQYSNHSYLKTIRDTSIYSDQESHLANEILNVDYGSHSYQVNNLVGKNYPVKNAYQEFASKGTLNELASALMSRITSFNGRYQHKDLERVTNSMLTLGLNRVYERNDITIHHVNELVNAGEIKPIPLWDTQYFKDNIAPTVDDELVQMGKEYMEKFTPVDSLIYTLKDNLSKGEIFNSFIPNQLSDINKWQGAMAQFAHFTGERLTFDEARALNPIHNFVLSSTQAYSDLLDKDNNPDDYINISMNVELNDDADEKYDGEQMIEIYLECKSLKIASIEDIMADKISEIDELSECGGAWNGINYEGSTDSSNPRLKANDIALKLKDSLRELQAKTILPGDVVQILDDGDYPAEEYGMTVGKKVLVTDVNNDGDFKIKGNKEYAPACIGEIKKKHVLKYDLDEVLGM